MDSYGSTIMLGYYDVADPMLHATNQQLAEWWPFFPMCPFADSNRGR